MRVQVPSSPLSCKAQILKNMKLKKSDLVRVLFEAINDPYHYAYDKGAATEDELLRCMLALDEYSNRLREIIDNLVPETDSGEGSLRDSLETLLSDIQEFKYLIS